MLDMEDELGSALRYLLFLEVAPVFGGVYHETFELRWCSHFEVVF